MDKQALNNTITEIKTASGTEIRCTLNFFLLYGVKTKYPETYKRYNKIMMEGMDDLFDAIDVLYTGYLCALPEGGQAMGYTEFMQLFEDDVSGVMIEAGRLMGRKKKAGSVTPS